MSRASGRKPHNGLLALQALSRDYHSDDSEPLAKSILEAILKDDYTKASQLATVETLTEIHQERSKAPKCKSKAKPLEKDIQRQILALLKRHPKVAWAERMNTGAFKVGANSVDKGRFFRSGFVGCSDIIGQLKTGQLLAVEVKRKGGKLSEPQRAFIENVNKYHAVGIVAYSVDDVIKRLEDL